MTTLLTTICVDLHRLNFFHFKNGIDLNIFKSIKTAIDFNFKKIPWKDALDGVRLCFNMDFHQNIPTKLGCWKAAVPMSQVMMWKLYYKKEKRATWIQNILHTFTSLLNSFCYNIHYQRSLGFFFSRKNK